MTKAIAPSETLRGDRVSLRLVTQDDCTERYVAWLADPEVNRFLETRFAPQPLDSVRAFVKAMTDSPNDYLFAICETEGGRHVGNVKVGPIVQRHGYADVSYFIGERAAWGKGYGTEAVRLATRFAFDRLGLHRCQAGLYASNVGSARVLEKAGYTLECRMKEQLKLGDVFEDHVWFAAIAEEWR